MRAILNRCIGFCAILCAGGAAATASAASPWEEMEAFETHRPVTQNAAPFKPEPETPWGGWYAGLHAGAVILPDTKFTGAGLEFNYDFDTGFALGGSVGYAYIFGLRLESEVTFRANQAERFELGGAKFKGSGNIDTLSLMLNGWFDIKFLSFILGDWVPYVGAGAGVTYAWSNIGSRGTPLIQAEDTNFLWQGGAGLSYRIMDNIFFAVDYRFLRTFDDFSFDDRLYPEPITAKYKVHNVMFGIRGSF
jgi:opacity protein-like surface antigen